MRVDDDDDDGVVVVVVDMVEANGAELSLEDRWWSLSEKDGCCCC